MTAESTGQLQPGGTYIFDEAVPSMAMALFDELVRAGRAGLCISGEPPELVRKRLAHADKVEFTWVTDASAPGSLRPAMIDQINARRERFLDKHPCTILILDIFAPLESANDFSNLFKFFSYIRDDTHHRDSITLVSLDSKAMEESRFRKIGRLARAVFSAENPPEDHLPGHAFVEGQTYILRAGARQACRMAARAAGEDRKLMCVVRTFPDSLREKSLVPASAHFRWLSKTDHPDALRPDDQSRVFDELSGFMGRGRTVLVLDGIDILIAEMGFNGFYKLAANLKDLARVHKGILLISVTPGSLSAGELGKLASEAEQV